MADSERRERRQRYHYATTDTSYLTAADAAMAVADEEIARVEVRRQEAIHALDAANAEIERLRAELARVIEDRDLWQDSFYEQG